jgi:hypothetical protein
MNKVSPFVWDRYPTAARLGLTFLVLAVSGIFIAAKLPWIAGIGIILAAIAFHTEYRLTLDPSTRTYIRETYLKPFGVPVTGSFDEVRHIHIDVSTSSESPPIYYATFKFKPNEKFGHAPSFKFFSGNLDAVLREVARVVDATGIDISESEQMRKMRASFVALSGMVERPGIKRQ